MRCCATCVTQPPECQRSDHEFFYRAEKYDGIKGCEVIVVWKEKWRCGTQLLRVVTLCPVSSASLRCRRHARLTVEYMRTGPAPCVDKHREYPATERTEI